MVVAPQPDEICADSAQQRRAKSDLIDAKWHWVQLDRADGVQLTLSRFDCGRSIDASSPLVEVRTHLRHSAHLGDYRFMHRRPRASYKVKR